jgi:hypothetical protein
MAKKKVSAFTAVTDMGEDDCFPVVTDIASTPKSRRIALRSLRNRLYGQSVFLKPSGADDTAAINAILAGITPNTRVIFRGAFSVSDTLTLAVDDVILDGDGASITQTGTQKKTITLSGVSRCRVSGFRLIGNGTEDPWAAGNTVWNGVAGVYVTASNDVAVERCHLSNHAGGGIQIHGICDGLRIERNRVIGMGTGGYNDNGADACIGSAGNIQSKNGLIISGNYLSGHAHGIFATTGQGMLVVDNVVRDIFGQMGLYIQQGGDMTVAGNSFYNIAQNAIKLQNQNAETVDCVCNITGNSISKCGDSGVAIMPAGAGDGYYTTNTSIIGNNIYDVQYGLYVKAAKNVLAASNRIRKCSWLGMYIWDSQGDFLNNRISQCEGAAFNIYKPQHRIVIDGATIVDCPINAGASTAPTYRCMAFVSDEVSPNNGKVLFSNIRWRFEDYSPPANLQAALNGDANAVIEITGPFLNSTTVVNSATPTITHIVPLEQSKTAPTAYTNRASLYAFDVSAGNTAIHAMTEGGKIIKLYQQAHIADAAGGTEIATINAILAALENAGFLATS